MTPRGPWLGQFTDGQTAEVHQVQVRLDVTGFMLTREVTGVKLGQWPLASLKIDDSFKGLIRVTSMSQPQAEVTVAGSDFRAALVQVGAVKKDWHPQLLILSLVFAVVALVGGLVVVIDPLAKSIALKVPMSIEYKVKESFAKQYGAKSCSSLEGDVALGVLSRRLGADKTEIKYDIRVEDKTEVNAFALPGGVIFLTKGLLKAANSADEVAGVLAHEMEHVRQRHIMASLVRSAMLTGVWQVAVGDFTGILAVDPSTVYQLATLKYDRNAEAEADAGALKTLDKSSISRKGFAEFFERLKKDKASIIPDILSTHPDHDKRIALINAKGGAVAPRPALSEKSWEDLRAICGPEKPQDKQEGSTSDD